MLLADDLNQLLDILPKFITLALERHPKRELKKPFQQVHSSLACGPRDLPAGHKAGRADALPEVRGHL